MTKGARRVEQVLHAIRETGIVTGQCRVSGPGTGQTAWCNAHGWGGAIQACHLVRSTRDTYSGYDCPNQRIAAWIERRHQYAEAAA